MEISNNQTGQHIKSVNFLGKNVKQENQTQASATKNNNIACTMLGTVALAASAIAAIALKGQYNVLNILKKPMQQAAENLQNLELKNLDIDLFKKLGKFEKGKALVNGKLYTGNIYTKNGYKVTYINGILNGSETIVQNCGEPAMFKAYNSEGKLYFSRNNRCMCVGEIKDTVVDRLKDGTIVTTAKRAGFDGNLLPEKDIITTIKPDGTITRLEQNLERYRSGIARSFTYDKTTNLKTGEVKLTKKRVDPPILANSGVKETIRKTKVVDGQKVFERVGKDGKVTSWTNSYDAKTGVATQTIKEPDGNIVTVMHDKQGNKLIHKDEKYHYYIKSPYTVFTKSKEDMQKFIKEERLPFVIE